MSEVKSMNQDYQTTITEETPTLKAICQVLEEAGVEYLFGLPGGNMSKMYPYLYGNENIKPILVRHEQVASIMSEVYGRLTGKPGVYASQGAWAIANGTMGAIEALQGSSPMMILTDMSDNAPYSQHAPYQIGTGEYGGYDVKKAMEAVTKYTTAVYSPEQAVQGTQIALKHSLSGNPGPVSVVFHSNSINGVVDSTSSPKIYHTQHYFKFSEKTEDPEKIQKVADELVKAAKPYIIAGSGVHRAKAYGELKALSEQIGAPIGTTAGGKTSIEETHPNAVGVMGNWGQDVANKFLQEADVVLVVGSRLTPTDTVFESLDLIDPARQTLIQIDIEEKNASWTYPVDQTLIGDAKAILTQILDNLNNNGKNVDAKEVERRITEITYQKDLLSFMEVEEGKSDVRPILTQRVVKEIEKAIDEKTIITLDSGENRVFMTNLLISKAPGSIIAPTASGAMGYSMPAALATKLVHPDHEVLAVCGDGSFPMTMNALLTAVQYDLKIVVLVMNNSSLGWVKNNQGDKVIASTYDDCDFSAMAKSFGCEGIRVTDPDKIGEALETAFRSEKCTVIDVITTDTESYKKAQSSLMQNR
ncbi:thiamine pyrophosphate-binding protein [Alkalihalobacillus sp. BA299]|uniref:thiamine pyrophosphate-binding protein n=1 Tax=Alkalihalobacillus sp. BA299 TaxID=2815938 RepID=UPI001ADD0831|nr:thiamine pyrophosphate-binding protein [Alkalihalobacillus sp. BA299]